MRATGIGLGGIDGVWWTPSARPYSVDAALATELALAADGFFALFDAAAIACDDDEVARSVATFRAPAHVPRNVDTAPMLCLRPDFQVLVNASGRLSLRATEIEACPSAMGVAHALQRGYGLTEDMADCFAVICAGRPLRIVIADAWREFAWDMLVLCRALSERGIDARVVFERPLRVDEWSPAAFGVPTRPSVWDIDVRARLMRHGFDALIAHGDPVPDALIYRFGYVHTFSRRWRERLRDWALAGRMFVNPPNLLYDSKSLLTMAALPSVSSQLSLRQRAAIDSALLETILLMPNVRERLIEEQQAWVIKIAGFDRGERAWGGRSLQVGASLSRRDWIACVDSHLAQPYPCVAQRSAPSAVLSAPLLDRATFSGRSRVRAFFVRAGGRARVCGVHLTLAGADMAVSESIAALQTPIVFRAG
jgi:hypothetical protein